MFFLLLKNILSTDELKSIITEHIDNTKRFINAEKERTREYVETSLDSVFTLCREIEDLEGLADAHMVKALVFLKHHNIVRARHELDCCSFIHDKIYAHCKAVQWLILYAVHLRLHGFKEGAILCLEYAEEFASKTRNQHLLNQVNQQLNEVV